MKKMNNENFITDKINSFLSNLQESLRSFVSASLFLQKFDYFILLLIIILLFTSLFASTNILGVIAILIIFLTVIKLFFIRGQNVEFSPSNVILFTFLSICFISVLFSPFLELSIKGFLKTLIYILFYYSIVQFFRFNKNKMVPLIFIISFFITIESLYSVIQSFYPLEAIATWQDTSYINPEDMLSRIYGTLKPYNPNLLCGYLIVGMSSIITICLWAFIGKHKKTLLFSIITMIIVLSAIFLTGSRGGYIAVFSMFITAIILVNLFLKNYFSDKIQKMWKKFCVSFICITSFIIVLTPPILKRILSIFILRKDSSTSFRLNVYNSTWNMFLDNWFSGIGVGNETFRNMYGLYMKTGFDALSAYSIFLEIAVESGIFALLLFIAFFFIIMKKALYFIKNSNQIEQKIIITAIFIMICGVFSHGLFDTIFFRPQLQFLFWTNIAIMTVILDDKKEKTIDNVEHVITKIANFVESKI